MVSSISDTTAGVADKLKRASHVSPNFMSRCEEHIMLSRDEDPDLKCPNGRMYANCCKPGVAGWPNATYHVMMNAKPSSRPEDINDQAKELF